MKSKSQHYHLLATHSAKESEILLYFATICCDIPSLFQAPDNKLFIETFLRSFLLSNYTKQKRRTWIDFTYPRTPLFFCHYNIVLPKKQVIFTKSLCQVIIGTFFIFLYNIRFPLHFLNMQLNGHLPSKTRSRLVSTVAVLGSKTPR